MAEERKAQVLLRVPESVRAEWAEVAELEGFTTVQAWLERVATSRAKLVRGVELPDNMDSLWRVVPKVD